MVHANKRNVSGTVFRRGFLCRRTRSSSAGVQAVSYLFLVIPRRSYVSRRRYSTCIIVWLLVKNLIKLLGANTGYSLEFFVRFGVHVVQIISTASWVNDCTDQLKPNVKKMYYLLQNIQSIPTHSMPCLISVQRWCGGSSLCPRARPLRCLEGLRFEPNGCPSVMWSEFVS